MTEQVCPHCEKKFNENDVVTYQKRKEWLNSKEYRNQRNAGLSLGILLFVAFILGGYFVQGRENDNLVAALSVVVTCGGLGLALFYYFYRKTN